MIHNQYLINILSEEDILLSILKEGSILQIMVSGNVKFLEGEIPLGVYILIQLNVHIKIKDNLFH